MNKTTAGLLCASMVGALFLRPTSAAADTILSFNLGSGSVLAGNATTPPTAFCGTTSACPGTPTYGLASNDPLSGTVSFDTTTDTMSFDLTLTQNATLGAIVLDAGSAFVGSAISVAVSSTTSKSGVTTYSFAPGTTESAITASLVPGSSFTVTENTPLIPAIECSATSSSGSCSLTIGTALGGADSLEITQSGSTYNGVMSISANLSAVPLPASSLLFLGGLASLLAAARRRALP